MRGRQIGTWIGKRESADAAPQETAVAEELPRTNRFWRFAPSVALVLVIIAVACWVRHEGSYRRFIASIRAGKVQYVEFQPYANSAFVRVTDERGIGGVADWLREARPMDRRYGMVSGGYCEMRIVMSDGTIKRLTLGPTGPLRSGGTLVQSSAYITLKGDGWERAGFSGGLAAIYIRLPVSAQLPFSTIPAAPVPGMAAIISSTAPALWAEVDASEAQGLLDHNELGQAHRLLARALAVNPNNGTAQQLMIDTQARIRIRLPLTLKELERELAAKPGALDREKYLQLREKLLDATLMADPGDKKITELRQRLSNARPGPRPEDFKEVLRLASAAGERSSIRDFAWSPDGATIATCGDDGRVRVWDTLDGDLLCSFPAAAGNKIYFSDDGRKVWVWNDQRRTWWDVLTGKSSDEAKVAEDPKSPYRVNMADSDIVSFTFGRAGAETLKQLLRHAGRVEVVKFSPDGDRLAGFADDKVLSIWGDGPQRGIAELSTYERLRRVKKLEGPSVFLEDGSILTFRTSISPQKTKNEPFKIAVIDVPAHVKRVKPAAHDQRLLVEMANDQLAVFQPDVKKLFTIKKPKDSCGLCDISPDGKTVAVGNLDGSVRILNIESGELAATLLCSPTRNRNWAAVEYSSDGGWGMACGVGFVSVWTTATHEQVFYSEKAGVRGGAAAFTPDGKGMAITYKYGGLRLLKSSLKESEAVGWDQSATRDPVFSKDGRWVASIVKSGEVGIFDTSATIVCHVPVKASIKNGNAMRFNEDGSVLLVKAEDGSLRLIEMPSGRELRRLTMKDEPNWLDMPCSFSSDGKYLIAGPTVWGAE